MRKILYLTLLALLLLPARAASSRPEGSRFTALFCPECWTYVYGQGATDLKGNCTACGNYPLELEVRHARWFWCSDQHRWLMEACREHAGRRCCQREETLAMVTRPGPTVTRAFYCPLHQRFTGMKLPLLGILACPECLRPMVPVWAAHPTWYWCGMEGGWTATPCPRTPPEKPCCTPRTGLLLAFPEPGPIAEQ